MGLARFARLQVSEIDQTAKHAMQNLSESKAESKAGIEVGLCWLLVTGTMMDTKKSGSSVRLTRHNALSYAVSDDVFSKSLS